MRIDWTPSLQLKGKAIMIAEAKSKHTYNELADIFKLSRAYVIELKHLGDRLLNDPKEVDPSYPPIDEHNN